MQGSVIHVLVIPPSNLHKIDIYIDSLITYIYILVRRVSKLLIKPHTNFIHE